MNKEGKYIMKNVMENIMIGANIKAHYFENKECYICNKKGVYQSFKDCKHCNVEEDSLLMCVNISDHKKIKIKENKVNKK